ncbi:hypothetical protein BJ742DRAFT_827581 [Cladochytrium replicatum]|nr:hypothetical protein BJ742DRAFT_827581 [Cladochytrium replicatum]
MISGVRRIAVLTLAVLLAVASVGGLYANPLEFLALGGKKKPKPELDPWEYWSVLFAIPVLVILGGIIAGLTIGLLSLDETTLKVLKRSGTPAEKKWAEQLEPIRKDTHLLLVTLLLANTVINETLPVLMHTVHLDGYQAVLMSTALIVVFGEIIPQALFARYGLAMGAFFAWPVRVLIWIEWIVAYPVAKLLDWILGHKQGVLYRRSELKELVALHGEDQSGPLTTEEVSIMKAVLDLRDKTVGQIMTDLNDVFMLNLDTRLDHKTMQTLIHAGHSRVPICDKEQKNIIGVVLVKQLVIYDPDDAVPVRDLKIRRLPRVLANTPLFDMLHVFEQGGSHMALVVENIDDVNGISPGDASVATSPITISTGNTPAWVPTTPGRLARFKAVGIVTLEDIIEELLGHEIVDETDVFVDIKTKVKVVRAFRSRNSKIFDDRLPSMSPIVATSTSPEAAGQAGESYRERLPLLPPAANGTLSTSLTVGMTTSTTGYGTITLEVTDPSDDSKNFTTPAKLFELSGSSTPTGAGGSTAATSLQPSNSTTASKTSPNLTSLKTKVPKKKKLREEMTAGQLAQEVLREPELLEPIMTPALRAAANLSAVDDLKLDDR